VALDPVPAPRALPSRGPREERAGSSGRPGSSAAALAFALGPLARPAISRSIEIGEIVVELGHLGPERQPGPEPQTGSLIAAIPMFRIGGGRR
jgi:hypothetical protein